MAAAISAGESLAVCVGRLLEVVPVSKADVRKAPPPPFRGSSSKHTHAGAHARRADARARARSWQIANK